MDQGAMGWLRHDPQSPSDPCFGVQSQIHPRGVRHPLRARWAALTPKVWSLVGDTSWEKDGVLVGQWLAAAGGAQGSPLCRELERLWGWCAHRPDSLSAVLGEWEKGVQGDEAGEEALRCEAYTLGRGTKQAESHRCPTPSMSPGAVLQPQDQASLRGRSPAGRQAGTYHWGQGDSNQGSSQQAHLQPDTLHCPPEC